MHSSRWSGNSAAWRYFLRHDWVLFQYLQQCDAHSPGFAPRAACGIFVSFPLFWLLIIYGWIVNVILGIVYGIKAKRGEWAAYPIIGQWFLPKEAS